MTQSVLEVVITGAGVALVYSVLERLWIWRLLLLSRYIGMDFIELRQRTAAKGWDDLALGLCNKLGEKGLLLSWQTERRMSALAQTYPLDATAYAEVLTSLQAYRDHVGGLRGTVAVAAWTFGYDSDTPADPLLWNRFDAIATEWEEYERWTVFLGSILRKHAKMELAPTDGDAQGVA